MHTVKCNKQELLVYGLLWGILFLTPLLGQYLITRQSVDLSFRWVDVFFVWKQYALFFAVFLVHNFLVAPLLVERQRRWLYFSLVAVLLALFVVVQCSDRPVGMKPSERGQMKDGHRPPPEFGPGEDVHPGGDFHPGEDVHPGDDFHPGDMPPPPGWEKDREEVRPPLIFGQHDMVATIIMILMLGMNLGVKLYFRQRRDREQLALLEKQNLEQQLEYLKYQINPHFLMNTLNNIHALIDIDAERAKDCIVELSKIMRFVLYEGSKKTVPLSRELAFTQDYITLMRMRVTDHVKINMSMPAHIPDGQIPPLVLITFVENAFKHGISYRQESFIDMAVEVKGEPMGAKELRFTCRNSRIPAADDHHGGVGLRNVRQRLDLIYGNRYTLQIEEQPATYYVKLIVPLGELTNS